MRLIRWAILQVFLQHPKFTVTLLINVHLLVIISSTYDKIYGLI
ncbi:hypothetical protein BH10PSE19_BH10PSE19_02820 [soil metagenome]